MDKLVLCKVFLAIISAFPISIISPASIISADIFIFPDSIISPDIISTDSIIFLASVISPGSIIFPVSIISPACIIFYLRIGCWGEYLGLRGTR